MTQVSHPQYRSAPSADAPISARAPGSAGHPLRRDYSPPKEVARAIRRVHQTALRRSLAAVTADHAAIVALIAASLAAGWAIGLPGAIPIGVVALVGIARCQRGLECMVHEASHHNWDRNHRRLNDVLADFLAAFAVFSSVGRYRPGHLVHHRRLGTRNDPDLRRYTELDIEALDRTSAVRFGIGVMVRLPRYFFSWWRAVGTDRTTVAKSLGWHATLFALLILLVGPRVTLLAWAMWLAAFVVVLPVIRFIGEAGEHRYSGTSTMVEATVTNEGWFHRLLIHPHNDGYHLTHHLWPGVPHHQLRRLHKLLLDADPGNYAWRYRHRRRILEEPAISKSPDG